MARARYLQLALAVGVMSCRVRAEKQQVADTAQARNSESHVAVSPATQSQLPCLRSDSLKAVNDTLRYNSLVVHEETGDLLGTEVKLVRSGVAWGGTVAIAQGELGQAKRLETIKLDESSGSLTLAWQAFGNGATFEGLLTCASLIGDFRWYPGAQAERDTLPRRI
jgi:hypothetical protein